MSQAENSHTGDLDLSEYQGLFIDESLRFLAALRQCLDRLTDDPMDQRAHREGRRAAHTLRGMASTMQYVHLANIGQRMERQFQAASPLSVGEIDGLRAGCTEYEIGLQRLNRAVS